VGQKHRNAPPMALGRGKVPPLRSDRNSGDIGRQETPLRNVVPEHSGETISNRDSTGTPVPLRDTQSELHIALVVRDLGVYAELKRNAFAVAAHDVSNKVILHFILQRKDQEKSEIVQRWALTELGLAEPKVTGLQYPEEIQLGWEDDESAHKRYEKD
jgi:hypothetical protein